MTDTIRGDAWVNRSWQVRFHDSLDVVCRLNGGLTATTCQSETAHMSNKTLLVGSIPLDTVEDVLKTFGAELGTFLPAIPDGEVGPRLHWISRVHYQVLVGHPDLEIVRRPRPDNGVERQHPHDASDNWGFRVREGVDIVRFGNPGWRLGFARDAVNSYFVFKTLREKGVLPPDIRFQVSMPMVNSVLPPRIVETPGDLEKLRPGYEEALAAELANIVRRIPAKDLAIQWDCSSELQDCYGLIPQLPRDGAVERNLGQIRRLVPLIPEGAALGYHLCFGTLGGWPRFTPDDLAPAVALANGIIEASGRRVDWMHIPAIERTDDAFYAPLAGLEPRGASVYLGLVHHMDTFAERLAAARKFLPAFGVAAYCGFGRLPPADMPQVLADHKRAVAMAG